MNGKLEQPFASMVEHAQAQWIKEQTNRQTGTQDGKESFLATMVALELVNSFS